MGFAAAQQVVGYELQLVMEHCPLVSYECYKFVTCMLLLCRFWMRYVLLLLIRWWGMSCRWLWSTALW
jgi:hypothetical protein